SRSTTARAAGFELREWSVWASGQRSLRGLCQRRDVPEPDRAVEAPGGQQLAVRREGHGVDESTVSFERAGLLPGGGVPHLDHVVARCGQQLAAGTKRHNSYRPA